MKKYSYLALFLVFFIIGCEAKIDTSAKDIKWDRETCQRCKMIISDRNYGVQVINTKDGDRFYFDDIGCAVLWTDKENMDWKNEALIYTNVINTGEWINATEAYWTYGAITPMNFGFSANKLKVEENTNYDFQYVKEKILGDSK